ncbi:unnamed protein product [Rhizophagus irregularis]|nr:unnamed protein product [Rhizophagus irregularis]
MSSEATLNRDIEERNKVNGIGFKTGSNKKLVFIEIFGGPESPVEKHVKEDTEKLIKEAMFSLISFFVIIWIKTPNMQGTYAFTWCKPSIGNVQYLLIVPVILNRIGKTYNGGHCSTRHTSKVH